MKIALCIGHSRRIDGKREGGAVSVGNIAEWDYNKDLAKMIADRLDPKFGVVIVSEYEGTGYGGAMTWLAKHLKDLKVDLALELHFNSATPAAHGSEWLYWSNSVKGMLLAKWLDFALKRHVPELTPRGIKPIATESDRGGAFLKKTHCVSVVAEPFFGSSDNDWKIATTKKSGIADAYAEGLTKYASGI